MFFKFDIALKVSTIVDRNSCSAKGSVGSNGGTPLPISQL